MLPLLLLPNLWLNYFLFAFVTFLLDAEPNQKNQEAPDSLPLRQKGLRLNYHLANAVSFIVSVATTVLNRLSVFPLSAFVPGGTALPAPAG
ncbi:MAG: hypothetical protein ACO1OQ_01165 [Rufibacter sp.]